ncbi:ATP phosphoribosyltransferase regulatory subunit [Leucothrix pacifica]|uniref:ATP phosphoribosyltransferase regulatory subunit n=1 Tax=Leucothrix pacifica TaxID=1247513 RepID=A0A317CL14_9GAMM|nr:ATP phosphoribosyltransferase regulatory subunit [Leucothrix pacifica]PWQ99039.1 ATP phosphoribosyltransferase regulatory subunit [Leucothrix pacifica]
MKYWLLPDGINESLPAEADALETMRRELLNLYRGWGYRFIMTPLVEYLESLSIAMGSQLDLQTFKITDQTNGRLMGVRADITPQVARIDSHRMSMVEGQPNRLCYMGSVLRTHSEVAGGSRSPIQIGAELFGHEGLESDYEVIKLMLETLSVAGARSVLLDLGHVGVLRGLIAKIGLTDAEQAVYLDMLARKSLPEISHWIKQSDFDGASSELLSCLPNLHGGVEILETATQQLNKAGDNVLAAIDYLQQLITRLQKDYPELAINIDLAEMRGYTYHTGIVYSAYAAGSPREVARGGRYDGIGEYFGNARPATGFTSNLRTLISLSEDSVVSETKGILAPAIDDAGLEQTVKTLRAQGEIVVRQLVPLTQLSAEAQGCDRVLEQQSGEWHIVSAG